MDPTPEINSEKADKSYLSAAVESLSAWGTIRSPNTKLNAQGDGSGLRNQFGGDRITQQWYGLSLMKYPSDCPPLNARWFHAVDVPKRRPKLLTTGTNLESKPAPAPKKFKKFSEHDSRSIEAAYQQLADEFNKLSKVAPNAGLSDTCSDDHSSGRVKVPVQEDFLFDVDVEKREIAPVYWLGAIYEVCRGSWFYQEGTTLRPCEENLAAQLEEGYLKIKPFRYPKLSEVSFSSPKTPAKQGDFPGSVSPQPSVDDLETTKNETNEKLTTSSRELPLSSFQPQTYRLFGTYMNSIVTYQDSCIAWLSADSIMSRVSSTVYQKFVGGGYLGGVKLIRGYTDLSKTKDIVESKGLPVSSTANPKNAGLSDTAAPQIDQEQRKLLDRRLALPSSLRILGNQDSARIISNEDNKLGEELEAEDARRRDENEIRNDYNDRDGESQGRQIDHLILCTHGIGQRLGMRTESVNFVHDVNILRQTLKSVYENSADLQALNSDIDKLPKNCRVQVLPICWRHLLDFPQKEVRQNRKEHDLGDAFGDEDEYPSLEDITIDGVPFVRSLITDLALDILLFQSAYREHICNIVLAESNRIFRLFKERNPEFKGKVSLLGHSLGSAILFDLLSHQKDNSSNSEIRQKTQSKRPSSSKSQTKDLDLAFDVEDFYCYGSPIGLFQMLRGRNISARKYSRSPTPTDSGDSDFFQNPFGVNSAANLPPDLDAVGATGFTSTVSSPKVGRLYNIFHPSDPIAYRLEPLISPAMSSMKPQSMPYTKRTISSSMSGIGAKVGQSVSGMWTSFSSGLASSLFNRSLGLTNDDIARMEASSSSRQSSQTPGANMNSTGVPEAPNLRREETSAKKKLLAMNTAKADQEGTGGATAPTLIDDDIETLYSGFQKARQSDQKLEDENGKRLKREEAKVRALNPNGRVDYCLQEAFLDINPMNTIASHMSYWADEDVSHFMMSQLLSRHRKAVDPKNKRTKEEEHL